MKLKVLTYNYQENIIDGAKLFKIKINRDRRGSLTEVLKSNWKEVYGREMPFAQCYFSVTNPGCARDENLWHYHPTKQTDRFFIVKGNAVFALYDWRKSSKTFGILNLFLMGEKNGDDNRYLLVIPKNVLHGFCPIGNEPCCLLAFPTTIYDSQEEGRIPLEEVGAKFPDGTLFSWERVRKEFSL